MQPASYTVWEKPRRPSQLRLGCLVVVLAVSSTARPTATSANDLSTAVDILWTNEMPEVPSKRISWPSPEAFARAVDNALRQYLPPPAARLLTAHVCLSTNWGKSVDNYRLAGVKASATWRASRSYTVARSCECQVGYANDPTSKYKCASGTGQKCFTMYWRAYDTLDEAARDLVASLRQSRYNSAYQLLLAGDTEYFAQVGRDGWYTADPVEVKAGGEKRLATINSWLGETEGGSWLPVAVVVGLLWYALT